jgi:XTP/dITP diphosphohydrolase
MKLVFATLNPNKLKEIRQLLPTGIEVLSPEDLGFTGDIEETGSTLAENALLKARFIHAKFGADCFADDSGLEVEALGGAPGVYSARYAGKEQDAGRNMEKLLSALQGSENRRAAFRTVIALVLQGREYLFDGSVQGSIISEKRGAGGFGYDPLFVPDGHSRTFAEMSAAEKNSLSHRARAVNKLVDFLKQGNPEGDK